MIDLDKLQNTLNFVEPIAAADPGAVSEHVLRGALIRCLHPLRRAVECRQELERLRRVEAAALQVIIEWDDVNAPDVDCTDVEGRAPESDSYAMGRLRQTLGGTDNE